MDDVEARQERRKRDEGSDRAVVNQHLHHRAEDLAADDLHGRKRRDLQQLKRCLGPLFDDAAIRREWNDDQSCQVPLARRRPASMIAAESQISPSSVRMCELMSTVFAARSNCNEEAWNGPLSRPVWSNRLIP